MNHQHVKAFLGCFQREASILKNILGNLKSEQEALLNSDIELVKLIGNERQEMVVALDEAREEFRRELGMLTPKGLQVYK